MRVIEAKAVISAKDATGTVFQAIQAKLARLQSAAKSATGRANAALARADTVSRGNAMGPRAASAARAVGGVGAGLMGVPGLGVAGAAYGAVKAVKRYAEADMAMMRVGITADATDDQIKALDKTIRDTAFSTGTSFDQVTKGLESMVAGGTELGKALAILPSVTKTAQASGAEVEDMATTALALSQSLGIAEDKMQGAFDTLVKGGKEGKFELKDMSRYMASFGPIAAAAGYTGEAGLQKIVAVLQTIRQGSGSAEEAASSFTDLLGKMETDETSNKFKKFGIDIRKELDLTRKSGGDLIERFVELSRQALKGDLSKLPLLAGDKEMRRGLLALLTYGDTYRSVLASVRKALGETDKDLARVLNRPQMALNRLSESFDKAVAAGGRFLDFMGASKGMNETADAVQKALDFAELPPEERQRKAEETVQRTREALQIRNLDSQIAAQEASAKAGKPSIREILSGNTLTADQRLNSPALTKLRQQAFDLRQKFYTSGNEYRGPIFDSKEVERWRKEEGVRGTTVEFDGMTGDKKKDRAALNRKRISAKMGWDRPAPNPDGNYDALDLGYQGGGEPDRRAYDNKVEVSGSAEVKGQTEVVVKFEAGSSLIALESNTRNALADLRGMMRLGRGPGSTGRSSPDAAAPPTGGASGSW